MKKWRPPKNEKPLKRRKTTRHGGLREQRRDGAAGTRNAARAKPRELFRGEPIT